MRADHRVPGAPDAMSRPAHTDLMCRHGRPAVAVIAIAFLALLAAACNGSGSSGAGVAKVASHRARASSSASSSVPASALAFSRCMRSHGVSQFPDPDSSGGLPKVDPQQLGVSSSRFQAAQNACAYLLQPSNAQVQQTLHGMRDFARCMRSNGVHNWPDPTTDSDGQPVFDLRGRINPDSPQIATKSDQCAPLLHPAAGQDGTVLCNGIGEDGCHHYGRPIE
jgi:hypothetical protein